MDSLEDARKNFLELEFILGKYSPFEPPKGDEDEIKKLRAELEESKDHKATLLLEGLLDEQINPQREFQSAIKHFISFKGMEWEDGNGPYIEGCFTPHNSMYLLHFVGRRPTKIIDSDYFMACVGIPIGDYSDRKLHYESVESIRGKIPLSIKLKGALKLMPPFSLNIESEDIFQAHKDLCNVMSTFGYREGVLYKPNHK